MVVGRLRLPTPQTLTHSRASPQAVGTVVASVYNPFQASHRLQCPRVWLLAFSVASADGTDCPAKGIATHPPCGTPGRLARDHTLCRFGWRSGSQSLSRHSLRQNLRLSNSHQPAHSPHESTRFRRGELSRHQRWAATPNLDAVYGRFHVAPLAKGFAGFRHRPGQPA